MTSRKVTAARKALIASVNWSKLTPNEAALAMSVTKNRIHAMRRACGLTGPVLRNDERNSKIEDHYRSGMTLDAIGALYGITRERVRQIVDARGVPERAAAMIRGIESAQQRESQRRGIWDSRCWSVYGCTFEIASELNDGKVFSFQGSTARCYVEQRRNALRRGIPWEITFPEWVGLWRASGRWVDRGRGGYVMSRIGDSGPYKVGNVEIITSAQNASDSYLIVSAAERAAKRKSWYKVTTDPLHMSPRVKEVADLYAAGLPTKAIADSLGITYRAAWQYVDQVKRKLALANEQHTAAAA